MGKYKIDGFRKDCLYKFYSIEGKNTNQDIESVKKRIQSDIVKEFYEDGEIEKKIRGMLYRNNIRLYTQIGDDVVQETFFQLSKYDIDSLFISYCDKPSRILGLLIRIATRAGFGKLNVEISPNQSVVKQIMFASNLNKVNFNTDGSNVGDFKELIISEFNEEDTFWNIIKSELTQEENDFLYFLLTNIYNKRNTTLYGKFLREEYMSYTEYKLNLLMLFNRIREIVKKNKLKYDKRRSTDEDY